MKYFISFIIAIVAYLVLGLIAWNIVCSNIDIMSKTLVELSDYRLFTYSGLTFILGCILANFDDSIGEVSYFGAAIAVGIPLIITLVVNHWENVWDSVSMLITLLYNLINIIFISIAIRPLFGEDKK
jgi:hypothetical protein